MRWSPPTGMWPCCRIGWSSSLPEENAAFAPTVTADDVAQSFWALAVSLDALTHKGIVAERRKRLAEALGTASGLAINPAAPPAELKADVEQQLARRCYRKLVPTAAASLEHALALREVLLRTAPQYLSAAFRAKRDVEIALNGLPHASKAWPGYSALVRDCLRSDDPAMQLAIVEVYAKADAVTAAKVAPLLADRWTVAADAKLKQDAKVRAIRKTLGIPDPSERLEVLAKAVRKAQARGESGQRARRHLAGSGSARPRCHAGQRAMAKTGRHRDIRCAGGAGAGHQREGDRRREERPSEERRRSPRRGCRRRRPANRDQRAAGARQNE